MTSAGRLLAGEPVEEARVDRDSVALSASSPIGSEARSEARCDDARDRQMILPRKFEIALIVARNAEDRPRSVVHQHEIRDVDRQPPVVVERMHHLDRRPEALLLRGFDLRRAGARRAGIRR